jgi:hypothetical protein
MLQLGSEQEGKLQPPVLHDGPLQLKLSREQEGALHFGIVHDGALQSFCISKLLQFPISKLGLLHFGAETDPADSIHFNFATKHFSRNFVHVVTTGIAIESSRQRHTRGKAIWHTEGAC